MWSGGGGGGPESRPQGRERRGARNRDGKVDGRGRRGKSEVRGGEPNRFAIEIGSVARRITDGYGYGETARPSRVRGSLFGEKRKKPNGQTKFAERFTALYFMISGKVFIAPTDFKRSGRNVTSPKHGRHVSGFRPGSPEAVVMIIILCRDVSETRYLHSENMRT